MKRQPITIVQGGQWGSEAKGAITGYLCQTEAIDICIRTGAVNAGHTVIYDGSPVKMQQLPVGWVNPNTQLVIGAGAMVHPEILAHECELVSRLTGHNVRDRLIIDMNAGVHREEHTERSTVSGRHHAIGATGKGCSEAIIDKIKGRGAGYKTFGYIPESNLYNVGDTVAPINNMYNGGQKILIEGTQGTLLDINTGPYPFTTHKSTLPGAWMAECGLSPALPTDIVMVVRTYPIRVAGNSGPMPREISWPTLAREINAKRERAGLAPIVEHIAILAFEMAISEVLSAFEVPPNSDGLNQEEWWDRSKFRMALSELNAAALKYLDSSCVAELSKLFELTTVTKKLRRVARLDTNELRRAAMLCRPHRVALTFMNYEFPQYWFECDPHHSLDDRETPYIRNIERITEAPIALVSYGPGPEHIHRRA